MSERKVLNKYYPPDFDPSKIPRMKLPRNRQYTVRLMAPFNMRCKTCGEYIYKGKKFNARKEDVEGDDYLGIRIYRFYIKCTRCLQEISFKTDPRNTDYEIEAGATRNFMALKLAEEAAQREEDELKEEEASNPMKLLENRTKASKQELELLESLEELKDLNRRQRTIDYDTMLSQYEDKRKELEEEEDEKTVRSIFGTSGKKIVVEEIVEEAEEEDSPDHDTGEPAPKTAKISSSANFAEPVQVKPKQGVSWERSVGTINRKTALSGLVRVKKSVSNTADKVDKPDDKPGGSEGNDHLSTKEERKGSDSGVTSVNSCVPSQSQSGLSILGSYSGSDSD
ncbi:splicing factor YJU2 [Ischnura elegans]|uniref:splicing factor YJU2 n=1 Tax=Ischnura elegans TaxID=197161 RepID=UPI001ED875DD|nr:splicing factor YJU2 [Ischnura elegans]